jgi:phospholipid-binding lipoprotein MlaA
MIRKFLYIIFIATFLQGNIALAGSENSESLNKSNSNNTTNECFESFSRVMFKFNYALDGAVFEPIAKGYRSLPQPLRKGTGNAVSNLRSLLTLTNNLLQGDLRGAGNTAGRFVINTTVGIFGIFDPATKLGLAEPQKEDFGQTMGFWGVDSGWYFVLPFLGPTTARDAVGLIGNSFLDPVYQITHNTEISNGVIGNGSYSEHNYYYYRGTGAVDFRAKNIESFSSLKNNSIDLYASVKSLYLQDRNKKISGNNSNTDTLNDDDWEEIDSN